MKVVILNKSAMESNTFLFDPIVPKMCHSQVGQDQVVSMYLKVVAQ